jgi:catechol 2,3-dioxygenase-like lactoylglutathione lyase family enzyme
MSASASRIVNVIVPVQDVEAAIAFYTGKLGLTKRTDIPMGEEFRWVEVAPDGAETVIALCPPGPDAQAGGKQTGITLATADIEAYHARLLAAGVDADPEISRMGGPVPPLFWLRDPEGNILIVAEV